MIGHAWKRAWSLNNYVNMLCIVMLLNALLGSIRWVIMLKLILWIFITDFCRNLYPLIYIYACNQACEYKEYVVILYHS